MQSNLVQIFRENDKRSRLLNLDKTVWITERLESKFNENPLLTSDNVNNVIRVFNNSVEAFNKSVEYSGDIILINEADTVSYFIDPFISALLPNLHVTKEYKLHEQGSRLDAVYYTKEHIDKLDDNTNFIFMEYKKASARASKLTNTVYDVAKEHGLLQKQSVKSTELRYVLKGQWSQQMVQYLEAVKSINGGNTSAGIITNGLSYYFMMANGNDKEACHHSWSIVYCLDIAEIVEDYNNGINVEEAEIKLNTFVGLVYTFLSNSGRDSFFKWYKNTYAGIERRLRVICNNYEAGEVYDKYYKLLNSNNTVDRAVATINNFKKYMKR